MNDKFERAVMIIQEAAEMLQEKPDVPSRAKAARRKGKRGETNAASFFGELLFDDPKAFIRSPASGASPESFRGDISLNFQRIRECGYDYSGSDFVVEVKNDERFTLDELIRIKSLEKSFIGNTLDQLLKAASGKTAIAFITKNYRKTLILFPDYCIVHFQTLGTFQLIFKYRNMKWVGLLADDFFRVISEKRIILKGLSRGFVSSNSKQGTGTSEPRLLEESDLNIGP